MNLEDEQLRKMKQPWKFLYMLIRYNTKELLIIIIIIILGFMLIQNISYDKKNGFSWGPAAEIKVNTD